MTDPRTIEDLRDAGTITCNRKISLWLEEPRVKRYSQDPKLQWRLRRKIRELGYGLRMEHDSNGCFVEAYHPAQENLSVRDGTEPLAWARLGAMIAFRETREDA